MTTKSQYITGGENMLITHRKKPLLYLTQIQIVSMLIYRELNQKENYGLDIALGTNFRLTQGHSFIFSTGIFLARFFR
jgi:hypothetical protein